MICVAARLGEIPDGGLFPVRIPLVLAVLHPAVEHGLVLPLVRGSPQHERVLDPDTTARELEACVLEGTAEVQTFGISVEHIRRCALLTHFRDLGKGGEQELVEGVRAHLVVLDRQAVGRFESDVVWRVGEHEVGALAIHERGDVVGAGGVAADEAMPSNRPHIPTLGERGGFQGGCQVEVVVLHVVLIQGADQLLDFVVVEAGQLRIKIGGIQVGDEQCEFVLVPVAADLVQGDVERFLPRLVQFDDHAVDACFTEVFEDFEALVAADDMPGGLVPDDRFDVSELSQRPLEFFVVGVAGLQVFARVVVGGREFSDG